MSRSFLAAGLSKVYASSVLFVFSLFMHLLLPENVSETVAMTCAVSGLCLFMISIVVWFWAFADLARGRGLSPWIFFVGIVGPAAVLILLLNHDFSSQELPIYIQPKRMKW